MTIRDWILSVYTTDNPTINGAWGTAHILVLISCTVLCVGLAFLRKTPYKVRRSVNITLASLILFFELARRIINLYKMQYVEFETTAAFNDHLVYILVPRPWCAISCWLTIASPIINKKPLYNVASMCALICAIIFFSYPEAGFTNKIFLFENVYSIATHSLLLISGVSAITLGFCDFRYKRGGSIKNSALIELFILLSVYVYAFAEIILGIEADPLYFMPGSGVAKVLGVQYEIFLPAYIIFIILYFNLFYLFTLPKACKMKKLNAK